MYEWWHVLILLVFVVVFGGVHNANYGAAGGGGRALACAPANRTKCFECEHQLAGNSGWNLSAFRDAFMRNRKPILGV